MAKVKRLLVEKPYATHNRISSTCLLCLVFFVICKLQLLQMTTGEGWWLGFFSIDMNCVTPTVCLIILIQKHNRVILLFWISAVVETSVVKPETETNTPDTETETFSVRDQIGLPRPETTEVRDRDQ